MRNDPMMWQLTLARSRVNADGVTEYYYAKDTAKNRNAGRFAKMEKPRDVRHAPRGCGVTYDRKPMSRNERERLEHNAVARDLAWAPVTSEVTVVEAPVRSTLSARARRRASRA